VRIALTLAVAEACYRWIELPVRHGALSRWTASHRPRPIRLVVGPVTLVVLIAALTSMLVAPPVQAGVQGAPHSVVLRTRGFERALAPASVVAAAVPPASAPAPTTPAPDPSVPVPPIPDPPAEAAAALASPPPTTVVGDSVLAAIAPALTVDFPVVEIDAVTSRQPAGVLTALGAIEAAGRLGQVVVIGAGTNGAIAEQQLRAMLELARPARLVIVLNDHVERAWVAHNNALIAAIVPEYPNAVVFDWDGLASAHPEWLWADHIHPRPVGADAVAAMFRDQAVRVVP